MKPNPAYPSTRQRAASWAALPAWLAITVALLGVPVHAMLLHPGHGHRHEAGHCHDAARAEPAFKPPAAGQIASDTGAEARACALCERLLTATATPCAVPEDLSARIPSCVSNGLPRKITDAARPGALPARAPPRHTG